MMTDVGSIAGEIQKSIIPDISSYADVFDFLAKHAVYKNNDAQKKIITNTRIGDSKKNIHGGSYHIPDAEYPTFLNLYYRDIVSKNKKEYLTEKQRDKDGPINIDLDFRYSYETDERQHSREHVDDLICSYLNVLKTMFQFDSTSEFNIYLFEKPTVNRLEDKKITKDGIHMIIKLKTDRVCQQIIRDKMIPKTKDMWSELPIVNNMKDVFDEGISKGSVNMQLYGSRKPGYDKYCLTGVFEITYDDADDEFGIKEVPVAQFDMETNFHSLSVRSRDSLQVFMKSGFIKEYEQYQKTNDIGGDRNTNTSALKSFNMSQYRNEGSQQDIGMISRIKNADELELALNNFLDSVSDNPSDYDLKTVYDFTMILPEKYYGESSYDKWIRVGWVLKNTSNRLLIVWIAFSAKSATFQYNKIYELCEMWKEFDVRLQDGLTKLSLIHWAKSDAKEEYDGIKKTTIDYYLEQTISCNNSKYKAPDYDIANVLYQWHRHEFVCISNKGNIWYQYKDNRWKENDSGVDLRRSISGKIRDLYNNKSINIMQSISNSNSQVPIDGDNDSENDINKTRQIQTLSIIQRLGSTSDKMKLMTEAKELFYDSLFMEKLDMNPYLLCFNNGVVDFKTKVFRKGQPEDCISLCTNIDYIPLDDAPKKIVDEINEFMRQLFPRPELCKYMWEHLASTLIGVAVDQTFNIYNGVGQNGKSVLVNLMEKVLGEYKCDVPLTLVTEKRQKVGGLTPEIVLMKGKRYAVMQEPSKDEVINEGMMKQLTSGKDPIQGRMLHCPPISFLPQFKLVVTCNNLLVVKSNDHGTWRRIRTVPFLSLFTENPVKGDREKPYQYMIDKYIDEKFETWAKVFATMLVEIAFKTNGEVKNCDIVMEKSNEYRQSQDYLSEFIKDRIIRDDAGRIKKAELNNEFSMWYMSNYGGKGPSPKDLHEHMNKEFGRQKNQSWMSVRIRYEEDNEQEDEEEEEISMDDL
jgi:P4 family phage/plasmid primase-like protien